MFFQCSSSAFSSSREKNVSPDTGTVQRSFLQACAHRCTTMTGAVDAPTVPQFATGDACPHSLDPPFLKDTEGAPLGLSVPSCSEDFSIPQVLLFNLHSRASWSSAGPRLLLFATPSVLATSRIPRISPRVCWMKYILGDTLTMRRSLQTYSLHGRFWHDDEYMASPAS